MCVFRHQSYISTQCLTHKHTQQMNCHSPRVGVMTHSGHGEAVCLQSVRVYVWRSDTMALWQWWWVLLVSAQCIWQQGDVTVNGSVMTTGWLFHSWLPVHLRLTSEAIPSQNNLWGRTGFLTTNFKKSSGLCIWNKIVSPTTNNQWKDHLEPHFNWVSRFKYSTILIIFNMTGWLK